METIERLIKKAKNIPSLPQVTSKLLAVRGTLVPRTTYLYFLPLLVT